MCSFFVEFSEGFIALEQQAFDRSLILCFFWKCLLIINYIIILLMFDD